MVELLKSVMHGQYDAKPIVNFPATQHHGLLNAAELYYLVMGYEGINNLSEPRNDQKSNS